MTQELFASYSFLLDRTARKVKQYAQQQFKQGGFDVTVDQWLVLKNLRYLATGVNNKLVLLRAA